MLLEDYISFDIAKLLKEKLNGQDFCTDSKYWYTPEGDIEDIGLDDGIDGTAHNDIFTNLYPCITLQMMVKYLRTAYNVHIEIRITNHSLSGFIDIPKYYWVLFDASKVKWMGESTLNKPIVFDTPEEAYANAIKYCLEKII